MRFTSEERRLIVLYCSASRLDTITALWEALPDIEDNGELVSAWNAIGKLGAISDSEFAAFYEGVLGNAS